jgi:hypothetical protein
MSKRQIAVSIGASATAARIAFCATQRAGLAWPLPEGLTGETLELALESAVSQGRNSSDA